ncbi:MAG: hypothetical protein U0787_12880 [Polyangia bacterium]
MLVGWMYAEAADRSSRRAGRVRRGYVPARRSCGGFPELADLLDLLAERHPLVLAAVADVDRSLIWAMQDNT